MVAAHVRATCPGVEWVGSDAVLGPYDYLGIFHAPDLDTASKVSAVVRIYGHAQTETWPATEWDHFKQVVRGLGEKRSRERGPEVWRGRVARPDYLVNASSCIRSERGLREVRSGRSAA